MPLANAPELPPDVDSDVELPSDVGSDDGMDGNFHSSIELPPDVEDESFGDANLETGCNCRRKCHKKVDAIVVETTRMQHFNQSEPLRSQKLYNKLRQIFLGAAAKPIEKHNTYSMEGVRVCRPFWEFANGAGHGTVDRMKKLILNGHETMPDRVPRPSNANSSFAKADVWLYLLWQDLAEHDPTEPKSSSSSSGNNELLLIDIHDHPLLNLSINIGGKMYARTKNLPQQRFEDLLQLYFAAAGHSGCSRSCFRRCWKQRWKRFMPLRNDGQGKRCATCARLHKTRSSYLTGVQHAGIQ